MIFDFTLYTPPALPGAFCFSARRSLCGAAANTFQATAMLFKTHFKIVESKVPVRLITGSGTMY
jgi:hypothetical protein